MYAYEAGMLKAAMLKRAALGDGTGPEGEGPRTGRRLGYCEGYDTPGYMNRDKPPRSLLERVQQQSRKKTENDEEWDDASESGLTA